MRILSINFALPYLLKDANYPVGGWAVELAIWLRALQEAGHEAAVLTWKGAQAYVGADPQIKLIETYNPKKGLRIAKYFYSYIPKLIAAAKAYQPNVIIQGGRGIDTALMAFVAGRLEIPFVYRVVSDADVDERYKIGLRSYQLLSYTWGLRKADGFLCQNQYQRDRLITLFPNKPTCLIHNPFPISDHLVNPPARAKRRYVAWIGVFRYPKNLPLLYRIARNLTDIKFHVAGMPAQKMDQSTKEALDRLHALPNVTFVGYVKRTDVQAFLSGAVMLLCTSHYEGFPNVFLEGLATGTPVLTRRSVDPDFIISHFGLGVSAEDEAKLLTAVKSTWEMNERDYDALAQRCHEYVRLNHSPAVKVNELVDALTALIR